MIPLRYQIILKETTFQRHRYVINHQALLTRGSGYLLILLHLLLLLVAVVLAVAVVAAVAVVVADAEGTYRNIKKY